MNILSLSVYSWYIKIYSFTYKTSVVFSGEKSKVHPTIPAIRKESGKIRTLRKIRAKYCFVVL